MCLRAAYMEMVVVFEFKEDRSAAGRFARSSRRAPTTRE